MKQISMASYEIKKSKFIAYYYEVTTIEEVTEIKKTLKQVHKKAKHIPYAYILTNTAGKSDDKEPLNTAGLPIYNLLVQEQVQNKAIFVVRYFGGTKLGASNLLRAYLNASIKALRQE